MCISPHMPIVFYKPSPGCKAYQSLVLNGTEPLKLLHLYGNLAIVVTTSNKLVAEPRQACMSPCRAHTCLSGLCNYNEHVHVVKGTYVYMYMYVHVRHVQSIVIYIYMYMYTYMYMYVCVHVRVTLCTCTCTCMCTG